MHRHKGVIWTKVLEKLENNVDKVFPVSRMEGTGESQM